MNTSVNTPRHTRRLLAALLCATVALSIGLVVALARAPHWNLDIERAMDAIGLAPGMVVGEAGAGDGYFTLPMARRVGAGWRGGGQRHQFARAALARRSRPGGTG